MRARQRPYVFSLWRFALRSWADLLFRRSRGDRLSRRRTPASQVVALVAGLGFGLAGSAAPAGAGSFDRGGRVGDYLDLVASANASGERVEIGGVCASACTMKLGARAACVHSDAQLWFHAARNGDGRVNALATLIMLRQYPRSVRAWAQASGALTSLAMTRMSGVEAIALGVPDCARAYSPRPTPEATVKACFSASDRRAVAASAIRICASR